METEFDLCVIGGGINGAGIARDAAGRGLSVLLLESGDLAQATSSASTKLIHGGLRYLEHHEFRLVREALKEREVLLNLAPHIVWPQEFVLPHDKSLRPVWMIRAGLFLYDHLAGRRRLQKSHIVDLTQEPYGAPLADKYNKGFSYADCCVDDARLVILNALDAQARGAKILTRTSCVKLEPSGDHWRIITKNTGTAESGVFAARNVVNATGPWVRTLLEESGLTRADTPNVRLVRGSHIIVKRLYEGTHAYILQQPDKRIVFAIPYEENFTLIGTTDIDHQGEPFPAKISAEETEYLLAAVNRAFKKQITAGAVAHTYSGVRPLFDDGHGNASAVTRDYRLTLDKSRGPALLSVFGGKITTYRKLAEQAVQHLFGGKSWTARVPLPGGEPKDFNAFVAGQRERYSWLPEPLLLRYARQYGTLMDRFLAHASDLQHLGFHFGDNLYEAEVRYLVKYEWARSAEDILWRRTKLGLYADTDTILNLKTGLPDTIREATDEQNSITRH